MNKLFSKARNTVKPDKCILCGKSQTSFCNSHLIPQLSFKNIAEHRNVLHASVLMGIDIIDIEKGVNTSGAFHFICNECDGIFFKIMRLSRIYRRYPLIKCLQKLQQRIYCCN